MSDRELGRTLTLLLDDLDQERQFVKAAVKESRDRQERFIRRILDVRNQIKFGQKALFTESAEKGESPAAEESARAAAVGADYSQSKPPLPSADDLDAHCAENRITEVLNDPRADEAATD